MGGLFVLSSIPGESLPAPGLHNFDKVAHFLLFLGLGNLIALRSGIADLLRGRPITHWTKGGWIALSVGLLYAVLNEVQQIWVPNRDFSYGDIVANVTGLLAGFRLTHWIDNKRRPQENTKSA